MENCWYQDIVWPLWGHTRDGASFYLPKLLPEYKGRYLQAKKFLKLVKRDQIANSVDKNVEQQLRWCIWENDKVYFNTLQYCPIYPAGGIQKQWAADITNLAKVTKLESNIQSIKMEFVLLYLLFTNIH